MASQNDRKFVIVTRKTRLENLIVRYNTLSQAKFFIEHSGNDFSDYLDEDKQYKNAVQNAVEIVREFGRCHVLDREYVSNYIFGKQDIVVAIGQDGLVANTLKYLDNQPLIGVNPDPKRWDGVLLPFADTDLRMILPEVMKNYRNLKAITLAQANLNNGQVLYGVNDLFIGQKTHVSARYLLSHGNQREQQSSSGIIISTGLGATGWFKSILSGASQIATHCYNREMELIPQEPFKWDSKFLYYTVREPYPSKWTQADMVFGQIDNTRTFKIQSQMPEGGVIFSDGMENDFLEFNSGAEVVISIASKQGQLVI